MNQYCCRIKTKFKMKVSQKFNKVADDPMDRWKVFPECELQTYCESTFRI